MTIFNTGISGLRTSQFALDVISNNIANADTDGYHRRDVHLANLSPNDYRSFQIGRGVSINYIERVRNQVTEASLTYAISDVNRVDEALTIDRKLESIFQTGDGTLSEQFDAVFAELTKLTSSPGERTQRGAVITQAEQLSNIFQQTSLQLYELRESVRFQIEQEVNDLNTKMVSLSELEIEVDILKQSQSPNSELDELDRLINEIASLVDVSRNEHSRSGTTLSFGNSIIQPGQHPALFETRTSAEGELYLSLTDSDRAKTVEGGKLAALFDAYNNIIPEYTEKLDELAKGFMQEFDAVHAKGVGTAGSFTLLNGSRSIERTTVPLNQSGSAFPIESGELTISVIAPDGSRRLESLQINAATDSLEDVAQMISNFDNLNATINPQTSQLQIIAQPGYKFDFTGNLETHPDLANFSGTGVPTISGQYTGNLNQSLRYEISGSGDIGVSDDLLLNVYNDEGAQIGRLNIGNGYEAGTELEVYEGVKISLAAGTVVDGDTFSSKLVHDADQTGLLAAAGLNSFFQGVDSGSIAVNERITNDVDSFASGKTDDLADTSNLFFMIELQESRTMSDSTKNFNEFNNGITTSIGIRVSTNIQLSSSLNSIRQQYEEERNSISGVDLNEELVYLQQFQKQYEASVRVIQTADAMLDELLNAVR